MNRFGKRPEGADAPAEPDGAPARGKRPVSRRIFTGGMAAVIVLGVAAAGGLSYAATALVHVSSTPKVALKAKRPLAPDVSKGPGGAGASSSGSDQYRPGYGWGDPNHNHTGPPGLKLKSRTPIPLRRTADGKALIATFLFTIDEQAHLTFNFSGPGGKKLLLTQEGTNVRGGEVSGPQTKAIQYALLVPRLVTFSLRIPANLVKPGGMYTITITATDPTGLKSTLKIRARV